MSESIKIIRNLTSGELSLGEKFRLVKDFSQELGWEPGEPLDPEPALNGVVSGHLLVEHGLENSAVISFLISPNKHETLTYQQRNRSLELSYNNLVDWHIYVEDDKVTYVYNRTLPAKEYAFDINATNVENLKSTMFDQITGRAPNPNFPSLDIELINNISFWKRNLAAELDGKPDLADYASLFNSIMFVRAAEDHHRKKTGFDSKALLDKLEGKGRAILRLVIQKVLKELIEGNIPKYVFDSRRLKSFDNLQPSILYQLLDSTAKCNDG